MQVCMCVCWCVCVCVGVCVCVCVCVSACVYRVSLRKHLSRVTLRSLTPLTSGGFLVLRQTPLPVMPTAIGRPKPLPFLSEESLMSQGGLVRPQRYPDQSEPLGRLLRFLEVRDRRLYRRVKNTFQRREQREPLRLRFDHLNN